MEDKCVFCNEGGMLARLNTINVFEKDLLIIPSKLWGQWAHISCVMEYVAKHKNDKKHNGD
jgi:hypothetical protein